MFKVIIKDGKEKELTIAELKPCQLALVVEPDSTQLGNIVMRTASIEQFEVMNLSNAQEARCWTRECDLRVKPLPKGTRVTLEVV